MTDPSPKDAVTDCSSGTPPGTPPALGEEEPSPGAPLLHVAPWTATHGQQEQKKLGDPARTDGVNLAVERSFGELTVATGCSGGSGANLKKVTISESMGTGMRSHDSIGRRSAGKRPRSPLASMCKHKLHAKLCPKCRGLAPPSPSKTLSLRTTSSAGEGSVVSAKPKKRLFRAPTVQIRDLASKSLKAATVDVTESTTVQQLKERLMQLDPSYPRGLLSIKTAAAQGIPCTDDSFLGELPENALYTFTIPEEPLPPEESGCCCVS